jgi:ABC-type dipeptide/oligopeptide/nickel transport system ATPase subunit
MPDSPLLTVRNLSKTYHGRWRESNRKVVLREIDFSLERAATLGVVGPSGSGKSTLARCIAGFEKPTSGEILFGGRPLGIQMIFQQPAATLNPRFTAREIVEEPLVIRRRRDRAGKAARALGLVGLPAASLDRRAHQFSGGERQRLAIARALVLEPELLILDESFAGLDPALQEQIAGLLRDLQTGLGIAYLLISHDLALVADLAAEIAVMRDGVIVERIPARELPAAQHPLTRELIAASQALSLDGPAA